VKRIWLRIGVLTLVGGLVATSATRNAQTLEALTAGIICGTALAYVGLRHTKFEVTPEGRFYTPHTYIGLAVTALFVGRLLYRYLYLSSGVPAMPGDEHNLAVAYQRSPLTLGIFAALVGYYVPFYAGVLVKTRASTLPPAASLAD
jgi:cytochrome b561